MGPNINTTQFTSGDVIKNLVSGKLCCLPDISVPCVDVRDTAIAHLNAIKVPEARNHRFLLVQDSYSMIELGIASKKNWG